MPEQAIAMRKRRVDMVLADGSRVIGEVYLGLYEAHRDGPQRLGDLLNGEDRFLPVRTTGEVFLVNLARIVRAQTRMDEEADELMRLGTHYQVRISTMLGEEIAADLYVNMPQSHRRVKDCLNQPQRFLRLFGVEEIIYLNTEYIVCVRD
jgi:hypothetical protein